MKLPVQQNPLHVADLPVHGVAPHVRLLLARNLLRDGILDLLPDGERPAPADMELFKALLRQGGDKTPRDDDDSSSTEGRSERPVHRGESRDAVTRVTQGHENAARHKEHVQDATAAPSLNIAALSSTVVKVYLENDFNRERVVRMALDDDLLPATRLSVYERDGRLAVDFVSMNTSTRERLCRGADRLAHRIAGDLFRDVSVKVAAHDKDSGALEVHADASLARSSVLSSPSAPPSGSIA